jgi:uncharacterized protein (DUF486 family)
MESASTSQLRKMLNIYNKILPSKTFPYVPFIIAAFFQSMAWVSGPIFLNNFKLVSRTLILMSFAFGEYLFMSPAMNAGVEILNMKEPQLVITYHVTTLFVFIFVNIFIFKKTFEMKYVTAFIFSGLSIYFANKE